VALGGTILAIVVLMALAKRSEYPEVREPDAISVALGMNGVLVEPGTGRQFPWQVHRTPADWPSSSSSGYSPACSDWVPGGPTCPR